MHPSLQTRHRLVVIAYERYSAADMEWRAGLREASQIVPDVVGRSYWKIGNPGSPMRRLFDQRARALETLAVARLKLRVAKERLEVSSVDSGRPRPETPSLTH